MHPFVKRIHASCFQPLCIKRVRVSHNKYLLSARTWSGGEVAQMATGKAMATREAMTTGKVVDTGEAMVYKRGNGHRGCDSYMCTQERPRYKVPRQLLVAGSSIRYDCWASS